MAIVAQDQVTLQTISGFKGTVTYYLLQSSALNPPSKPSTETPTGGWTTTEPAFSFDTTLTLYTVPKNLFGVNQFEYGAVQKSSQYEAAKAAYNKAVSTDNSASKTVTAEYAQVTSSTVAPTSGWVGTQPMARAGYFTWLRFKFVTGNGTISYSTPTNISVPQLYSITPYYHRVSNTVPEPWADVTEHTHYTTAPIGGTAIVVGLFVEHATTQRLLSLATWTYVQYQVDGSITVGKPELISHTAKDSIKAAWGTIQESRLGLGYVIEGVDTYLWQGPMRALVFDTELSPEQITAVTNWLMAGHYMDAPGTPIGMPELPTENLNGAGRNLLRDSAVPTSSAEYLAKRWVPTSTLVAGDAYTLTLDVTPPEDVTRVVPYLSNGYTPCGWIQMPGTDRRVVSSTFVAKYYEGRTPLDNPRNGDLQLYAFPSGHTGTLVVHRAKLESGNKATAWTPAPEDNVEYWQKTQSDWKEGTTLYGTNLIEFNDGTFQYTPVTQISSEQAASDAIYISNLAKELAEGLVSTTPEAPENPLLGQVWVSLDEDGNMNGLWRFDGSEWQMVTILTGLLMVPGEDGSMTLVGPDGVDAPKVMADIVRSDVLYTNVGGAKKFIVSDIPKENLEKGVTDALDTAESIGTRIVLDGANGQLIIARDKYRSGVSDTMTVLTSSSMQFMFGGQAVTTIDSATRQLTTANALIQGTLKFPSHTIKTLPGQSMLIIQPV